MGFKGKNAMAVEVYSDDEDMEADAGTVQEEEVNVAQTTLLHALLDALSRRVVIAVARKL